ncbi:hypothetical protein [Streptomyces sp. NPDC018693]|uniref:hypothetical protein n=1 Tax=unclassified Streptomyces TaxID=2593676 RepID=UPI0037A58B71
MKLNNRVAWVGLTAAVMVATAACGGGSASDTAKEAGKKAGEVADKGAAQIKAALSRATDRTEQLGSAEVRMTTTLGNGTSVATDGTYSWGDGFAFDLQMDTAAAQMQTLQDDPTMRMLFVDGAYYYDIDPQESGPLAGKEWMRIDGSALFGEKGAQALSGSNGSPSASMKGLKYADDVEDLGTATVNGKATTHYRAVVGPEQMGKFKDAFSGEDSLVNEMTGGSDSITMEIWVGDDDLPVRLIQELGTMKVTMDFEKFGRTAEVTAPPASETADMTDEFKKAQQQG